MNYIDGIALSIYDMDNDDEPTDDDMTLYRIYAVLACAKGTQTTAADVHVAWSAWMAGKSPEHWYLVPFDELEERVQRYDDAYVEAIHKVAEHMRAP
jgi:hypothetical protein